MRSWGVGYNKSLRYIWAKLFFLFLVCERLTNGVNMSGEWQHGLFGCFDNFSLCLISYFVPCYQFGKNAEAVGESCLLCGLALLVPLVDLWAVISIRGKIRESKGIQGSLVGDLLTWCVCPLCALVQESQELQGISPQAMARE